MTSHERTYRVLVVDDSPIGRKLLEHALEGEPFSLFQAKSGNEALELFAKHTPEIVITDWMMPDFSGPELCERIRASSLRGSTYIILITSNAHKEDIVKGLSAGADDYLTKPFDRGELLARIGVGCKLIELQGEIEAKNKQLIETAGTDPLTGLPNRLAIEEWAERQLRGAARHGYSVWIVHASMNCFRSIYDKYGRETGDAILLKFAEMLKGQTRASDICGRMGEDKFLQVLTHIEGKNIGIVVDRLQKRITSEKFDAGGEKISVTASFGVAGFNGKEPPDFDQLVRRAMQTPYVPQRTESDQVPAESI